MHNKIRIQFLYRLFYSGTLNLQWGSKNNPPRDRLIMYKMLQSI